MAVCPFKLLGLPMCASFEEIDQRCEALLLQHQSTSETSAILREARIQAISIHCTVACSLSKEEKAGFEALDIQNMPAEERQRLSAVHTIMAKMHAHKARRLLLRFATDHMYLVESRTWVDEHKCAAEEFMQHGMGDSRIQFLEERKLKWEARRQVRDLRYFVQDLCSQMLEAGLQPPVHPSAEAVCNVCDLVEEVESLKLKLVSADRNLSVLMRMNAVLAQEKEVLMLERVKNLDEIVGMQKSLDLRDGEQFMKEFKARQEQRKLDGQGARK